MWVAEIYEDMAAINAARKAVFLRWDDYIYNEQRVTRFLTGHTDEHLIFTLHEAEVAGGIMSRLSEQSNGNDLYDESWVQRIRGSMQSIATFRQSEDDNTAFEKLPLRQREGLQIFQGMSAAELFVTRLQSGYDPMKSSEDEHSDMTVYYGARNTNPELAERFLIEKADRRRSNIQQQSSKKRRHRDAKKAAGSH